MRGLYYDIDRVDYVHYCTLHYVSYVTVGIVKVSQVTLGCIELGYVGLPGRVSVVVLYRCR